MRERGVGGWSSSSKRSSSSIWPPDQPSPSLPLPLSLLTTNQTPPAAVEVSQAAGGGVRVGHLVFLDLAGNESLDGSKSAAQTK